TLQRDSMARMASARVAPARNSPSMRPNSSDSGPGTAATVPPTACSKHSAAEGGDGACERLLEAEAGFDADRQQVEDVGQLDPRRVLPLLHSPVEHRVGTDDEQQQPEERRRETGEPLEVHEEEDEQEPDDAHDDGE